MRTINLNKSLDAVTCHYIINAALRQKNVKSYIKFKTNISQHQCSNSLKNKNSLKSFLANNKLIKFKSSFYNDKNRPQIQQNESTKAIDNLHPINNEISIKSNQHVMAKENKQKLSEIQKSNFNTLFRPNLHTNKFYDIYKREIKYRKLTNYANISYKDESNNNSDLASINDFGMSYNLFPLITAVGAEKTVNHSIQLGHHDDRIKLIKLVMDGLGLKNIPIMDKINISQVEYVTKYREYLERAQSRKSRELKNITKENNERFLKPLRIYSVVSNSTLLSEYPQYNYEPYNNIVSFRSKRNAVVKTNGYEEDEQEIKDNDESKNQDLEERIRNILFLKKNYQQSKTTKKGSVERKIKIRLMFALQPDILYLGSTDIEEANLRLVLVHSPILVIRNSKNKKTYTKHKKQICGSRKSELQKNPSQISTLNLKLYFISKVRKEVLLDEKIIDIHINQNKPDETHTQWLQFDVLKAVKTTLDDKREQHVIFELQCDECKRLGARILNDAYSTAADAIADELFSKSKQLMPVLNIIGQFDKTHHSMRPHIYENHQRSKMREQTTIRRHYHHQSNSNIKDQQSHRRNCNRTNQRCCRHSMKVTFKEIKGFEFIIQPKVFDAGYCQGRCPPRFNPAHHHALLQSLIWKQNHEVPRLCCTPSKLVELEVLHVDEKDSEKLKISTWSDMKVVECACS